MPEIVQLNQSAKEYGRKLAANLIETASKGPVYYGATEVQHSKKHVAGKKLSTRARDVTKGSVSRRNKRKN